MDPETLLREQIENALITASWFDGFRSLTGIRGISQVWSDTPAWYFWIDDSRCSGAYELRLEGCEGPAVEGQRVRGCFSVRFFPTQDSAATLGFSQEEQIFLGSSLFDTTGTPRAEHRDHVPANLFQVGVIEMLCGGADASTVLTYESLDHWVTTCDSGQCLEVSVLDNCIELPPGTTVRNVPGWELGHVLFDRLVLLLAHHTRSFPTRARLSEEPGFEYTWEEQGSRERPAAGGKLRTLTLTLGGTAAGAEAPRAGETLLYDHACTSPSHPLCTRDRQRWLNHDWWTVARVDFESTVASSCGCSSHHCR